jgi:hypothetical protein
MNKHKMPIVITILLLSFKKIHHESCEAKNRMEWNDEPKRGKEEERIFPTQIFISIFPE